MELCLVTLCDPTLDTTPVGLNARLARLEQGGSSIQPAVPQPRPAPPAAAPVERPAAPVEDAPPWVVEKPSKAPAAEAAPRPRREETPPAPAPVKTSGQASGWGGWPALRDSLRGTVDVGDYGFLSNAALVEGALAGDVLTLWAANDFIKSQLDKPALLNQVAAAAGRMAGRAIHVKVAVGTAPAETTASAPPVEDALEDALEAFLAAGLDNLTVE